MILNLGCIVEGHGDKPSVPILLRRVQQELIPELHLEILPARRVGRSRLVQPKILEGTVEELARRLATPRAILILIDATDDCPKELAAELAARAAEARSDITSGVVLAKFEFEAWFLASIGSLKGRRGLPQDLTLVPEPEAIQDAKGFLSRNMEGSRAYSETADQPALTAVFDMAVARERSRSFRKCWREIERLFAEASQRTPKNGGNSDDISSPAL